MSHAAPEMSTTNQQPTALALAPCSARDRIARALALEFYRGQYREKTNNQQWLSRYTANMIVGSNVAAGYAEEQAQKCADAFWRAWERDADELLLPNAELSNDRERKAKI